MLRIGITGSIGSGKSTVSHIFEILGAPVYYADAAARWLMENDPVLKTQLIHQFGTETYIDGKLNRIHLSSIVFQDAVQLHHLNSIVHPATIADAEQWMNRQSLPYVLKEAALIFESGSDQYLNGVICITAPEHTRIARTMERDGVSREEVLSRMASQMDEAVKARLSQYIIINDDKESVLSQVMALHLKFLSLSEKPLSLNQ